MQSNNKQAGFTLIELMIVVVIASVLATMAVPSFKEFMGRTRQSSAVSQLVSDLNRARSEAIKRNARVLVCVRDTDTACGTGTNWSNGWLVCADADSNDSCDAGTSTNPNPVVVRQAINAGLTLTGPNVAIRYHPSGISGNGAATLTVGATYTGAQSSTINIAATGNISRP